MDARKLYLPTGYPSMYAWCVGALHLSEDGAYKRIQAARAARRFPAILEAVADGRLHLSAVVLLAAHLTEDSAQDLLAAAAHRSKAEVERLLAERFPNADLLAWVAAQPGGQLAPGQVGTSAGTSPAQDGESPELAPGQVGMTVDPTPGDTHPRVKPLSSRSFAVQLTLSRDGHDLLRQAQGLLGHEIPRGDIGAVVERALGLLVRHLEKRKFAATARPRTSHLNARPGSRHIPAHVKRAVQARDGGRCTFVGDNGHRCEAHTQLEFDHVEPFARGGEATVAGIRLRCRAHNQYQAECTFGAGFMRQKRIAAAEARAAAKRLAASVPTPAPAKGPVRGESDDRDVVPWLRALGFSAAEARRAAERCRDMPEASIEERVRAALTCFRVRGSRVVPAGVGTGTAAHG